MISGDVHDFAKPHWPHMISHSTLQWNSGRRERVKVAAFDEARGFVGKIFTGNHGFSPSNIGGSGSNCPIIQFYDFSTQRS